MATKFPKFSQGLAQDPTTRRLWFGIATAHDFETHDGMTEEKLYQKINSYSAKVNASETADGKGKPTNFRGFVGLQVNVPFVRLFVHVNKGLGNDLIGGNVGVKILY